MREDALVGPTSREATSPRLALAILFLVLTLNLFDRQLINILAQDIKMDLQLSDAELGLLTGTAFGLFKALFSIPVGAWADRSDRPRILGVLVAIFSIFTFLSAAAASFVTLAVARMGVGIGESATVPVASAMVRERFPKRATAALAIAMAGNPVGSFLAFLIGGLIAERWGWRWAFLVAGPPGLLLAAVVLSRLRIANSEVRSPPRSASLLDETLGLAKRPFFKPLVCATIGSMFMVSAANAWMPAFLIRVHHLGTAGAGLYVAIAVGLGGAIGSLTGIGCDRLRARVRHPESALMIATLLLVAPFLAVMIFESATAPALAAYFIYNVLAYAWLAPTIRLIQDAVEPGQRALAISVCSATAIFVGLGIGIPAVGWLSDRLTPSYGSQAVGLSLFLVVALAVGLSLISHFYVLLRRVAVARSDKFAS